MLRFHEVLQALADDDTPLTRTLVRRFSNISETERDSLMSVWGGISPERRRKLIHLVGEVAESDFDTDFGAVVRLALTDLHDEVRQAAVEASASDESVLTFHTLMPMASVDRSIEVRGAAMSALGRFISMGEMGKFSADLSRQAQNLALRVYNRKTQEPVEVRRRALEAISNSSRSEVEPLIHEAYNSGDPQLQTSAVYAMGRSCDEKWARIVLREMGSDNPAMRFEAVRASGELELEEAVPLIAPLLVNSDRQFLEASIWALGEIGGGEARRLLNEMAEYADDIDDEALMEMVEDALATASLGANFGF